MTIVASNSLTLSNVNDGATGIPGPKGVDGTDAPTITVKSYTWAAGSRAEIELTGPNAFKQTVYYRGHNVWVIDATTHKLKEFVSCDTYTAMSFSHNGVSTTLADYLASLTDSIVVIAASDADAVDQNVRYMLNSMGGFPDLGTWNPWRTGHVFIGMSKRSDGTWPLQPRQGYEEVINKDGSTPEIGCTLSKGGIVANGATGPKGADGKDGHDGIAGKDGTGIKTTVITYAISSSGTTAPSSGWTSQVPTLVKGQYLWTKTVWTYTDNSSETGYSVTYIAKDGNNGHDGIAGKDGVGIKKTTITYASHTNGTTAPTTGYTTIVPSVPAGQFLWTKTVWAYTDNTSETGYSVAKMGEQGPKGDPGTPGPAGSNGDPGKVIQQNTEPTTKFLNMLWQYTGTEPLNATGITVLSNIIYVWNGTAWQIWLLNPQNIQAVNAWITNAMIGNAAIKLANIDTATITELSAVTATLGDVEAGSITNDISYGFVAQGNHHYLGNSVINYRGINISETMTLDNVLQYTQSMGFDAITGLFFQRLSENQDIISNIRLIEIGNNEMGLYVGNATESATLTSKGLTLSTDVPWTTLSPTNGFSGGSIQFSVQNGVEFFSIAGLSVPQMNATQWYQAASLPAGSIAIPSINRVYPISGNNNAWDLLINPAGGIFIRCQAAVSATSNLVNGGCGFPIG
ncbi:interleukin-like EMT inducer domain-containing protein [Lactococcus lactis]|uniref:interleukin-like EMT inducer domain-containing protein n=1 Tax=Lactococcus lactis TaxID=1358 RepID=UPI0032ED849A